MAQSPELRATLVDGGFRFSVPGVSEMSVFGGLSSLIVEGRSRSLMEKVGCSSGLYNVSVKLRAGLARPWLF